MEPAIEQMKILNMDFGRKYNEKKQLDGNTVRMLQEKVNEYERQGFDRILVSIKDIEQKRMHTVPILRDCRYRSAKERLEFMWRKNWNCCFLSVAQGEHGVCERNQREGERNGI